MLWQKDELLAKDLKYRIFSKHEPFNQVICSERKISKHYSMSRNTVRKALDILIEEKIIYLSNKKYALNTFNSNSIGMNQLCAISTEEIQFNIIEKKSLEANKLLASKLNVSLGTTVNKIQYTESFKINDNMVPCSYNSLYYPDYFTFNSNENNHLTPFQYILRSINSKEYLKESQSIKLSKPTLNGKFFLQLSDANLILHRISLFNFKNKQFIFESEMNPKWSVIHNSNYIIEKKVDGFIE